MSHSNNQISLSTPLKQVLLRFVTRGMFKPFWSFTDSLVLSWFCKSEIYGKDLTTCSWPRTLLVNHKVPSVGGFTDEDGSTWHQLLCRSWRLHNQTGQRGGASIKVDHFLPSHWIKDISSFLLPSLTVFFLNFISWRSLGFSLFIFHLALDWKDNAIVH